MLLASRRPADGAPASNAPAATNLPPASANLPPGGGTAAAIARGDGETKVVDIVNAPAAAVMMRDGMIVAHAEIDVGPVSRRGARAIPEETDALARGGERRFASLAKVPALSFSLSLQFLQIH